MDDDSENGANRRNVEDGQRRSLVKAKSFKSRGGWNDENVAGVGNMSRDGLGKKKRAGSLSLVLTRDEMERDHQLVLDAPTTIVDSLTNSSLRQKLSERDLEFLELKSKMVRENSSLRNALKQREMDLVEREAAVRELSMRLHQEKAQLLAAKSAHNVLHDATSRKVGALDVQVQRVQKDLYKSNKKKAEMEAFFKKELCTKDSTILRYQRKVEYLESEVELLKDNLQNSAAREDQLRREKTIGENKLNELGSLCKLLESRVQNARQREQELEGCLEKLREERDRAEDSATKARSGMEKVTGLLNRERLQFASLQQEYTRDIEKLKEKTAESAPPSMMDRRALRVAMDEYKQEWQHVNNELKKRLLEAEGKYDELRKRTVEAEERCKLLADGTHEEKALDAASSSCSVDTKGELIEKLQQKIALLEERCKQAEWARVDSEKAVMDIEGKVVELCDNLEKERGASKSLQEMLADKDEKYVESVQHGEKLEEKLEVLEFQLEELRQEQQDDSNSGDLQTLSWSLEGYLSATSKLLSLLETYIDGEQPSMEMLLDDVDPQALPSANRLGNAPPLEELIGKVKKSTDEVSEMRSKLADVYAENLGSDCQVQ
uniref:Uncharacterized protein n=1 Tax=Mucochytrium quahogii TaxID=96639 RepID=A0A7S2RYL1_9STRA|mmetsp:Transcript_39647/g.64298  ORF Transcript_39647/g.64298 Transcript_39647/m.64298 type:complete len:607 (-) Transcript_39647:22-1842(-)|eukprot:CAMPEP_0203772334 /NCGR_PEP_ID=MMETSP0099_2-20121227/3970_1 /ASSEMBLY_ACC=CAM_ASM_000209 /TAXON_ID=96639 /ORGANISM=" , Strain NY0313808BC1" /LENGTH=606 /DNA_ID=CAMNT_0050669893 /DNA_START=437 /DNA_END=2257 /DNA_ORIENTATION=+